PSMPYCPACFQPFWGHSHSNRAIDYSDGSAPHWPADLGELRTLVETIASVHDILEFIEKHDLNHDVLRAPWTALISMRSAIARLSTSSRRKLTSILLAVAIFASLAMLTAAVLGRPVINGLLSAIII